MIKFISRHEKDYSRYNIIKNMVKDLATRNDVYILFPFSKNQFIKHFFKRDRIINDFFISNYDTYVYDRKKITKWNPRAWWKYLQDWINFRFSKYLLSDTYEHFKYWEELFGPFGGKLFVLPVLADGSIYFPAEKRAINKAPRILFYGSFIPLHGIDTILKAFKLLEENGSVFEAEIIGNGQTYKSMKQLYDALKLKHVTMDGELIKEAELGERIREADIVLGIFGTSTKAKSVVPNKVYQALACQKAMVTMESDALKEFFDESHLLTCTNTPEMLAETLKHLIANPQQIESLATEGHKRYNELYRTKKQAFIEYIQEIDAELEK